MTEPRIYPQGWYVDAIDRAEVVLFPFSHLELDGRWIALPEGQNVLYPRLAPDGTRFCGQGGGGAIDLRAMEWDEYRWRTDGSGWQDRGAAPGVNPVIYDHDGRLHLPDATTGSQGWRSVTEDGLLVTGDSTYVDASRRIWEYTDLGDVTVGQGGEGTHGQDPLVIIHQGVRRRVQDGTCRFIRARRSGDDLVLAWWQQDAGEARVLRCTVADLAQFPIDTVDPDPEPDPMPDISKYLVPRVALVETVKRDYPQLRGGAIVDQVAHRLNREHGLNPIRFGRKARQPDGGNPNEDALTFRLDLQDTSRKKLIDILGDGGNADIPMWSVRPEEEEPGNGYWTPPVNPDLDGAPDPDPEPFPESIDALVQAWIAAAIEPLHEQIADLTQRLEEIETAPTPQPQPWPTKVALKSHRGKYLCAESDDSVIANRVDAGSWETWTIDVMG